MSDPRTFLPGKEVCAVIFGLPLRFPRAWDRHRHSCADGRISRKRLLSLPYVRVRPPQRPVLYPASPVSLSDLGMTRSTNAPCHGIMPQIGKNLRLNHVKKDGRASAVLPVNRPAGSVYKFSTPAKPGTHCVDSTIPILRHRQLALFGQNQPQLLRRRFALVHLLLLRWFAHLPLHLLFCNPTQPPPNTMNPSGRSTHRGS